MDEKKIRKKGYDKEGLVARSGKTDKLILNQALDNFTEQSNFEKSLDKHIDFLKKMQRIRTYTILKYQKLLQNMEIFESEEENKREEQKEDEQDNNNSKDDQKTDSGESQEREEEDSINRRG